MAFFNVRQWIDRISQFPNRRTLTNVEDPTDVKTYDLSRAEGEVTTQGTALTGANLTDLENRIGAAFTAVENAMPEANPAETATGNLTKLKVDGTVYEVEGGGGGTTIEKITKAEWDAMTAEEREAFIGVVEDTNADYVPLTADNIPYDSENSIAEKIAGITAKQISYDGGADTVWDKIEEVNSKQQIYSITPSNQTVTPGSFVTIATLTVPKGVYVVNGFHDWTESFSDYYMDRIESNYERNLSARNGGGHSTTCIINVTSDSANIQYYAYLEGATNRTAKSIRFQALKVI